MIRKDTYVNVLSIANKLKMVLSGISRLMGISMRVGDDIVNTFALIQVALTC